MRFHIVVTAYTLWLIAMFGALYVTHGQNEDTSLQLVLICGALPSGLQLLLLGVDLRGLVAPVMMWLAFLLIVLLSYLVTLTDPHLLAPSPVQGVIPAAWVPIVYTLNVTFVLGIGTLIAGCPDRRLLRSIASLYCILITPFLVFIDVTGHRTWGNRLDANDLQSNVWGVMGLTVCLAALARKASPLAFGFFACGIATILAASSRESLVAVAAGLIVIGARDWRTVLGGARLHILLAGSCAILVVVGVLLDPYVVDAIGYIRSTVLALNDPNRGINSGFTGRTELWAAAFDVWLKSPLLGVGYRMHEQFLPDGMPGHSAYLAMLADTGVVGFVWFLALLVSSAMAALCIEDPRTRRFVTAMIVARVVSGFFDRVTINGGNLYGIFFIICCSVALAEHARRRAASKERSSAIGLQLATNLESGLRETTLTR
jgi:O-Antigen ligase